MMKLDNSKRLLNAVGIIRPSSQEAKAYQNLAINLMHQLGAGKTVVVTSSLPAEGKTEVSINLALSLAQMGKKVLLVDANFSAPALHRGYTLESAGFAEFLEGASISERMVRAPLSEYPLYIMSLRENAFVPKLLPSLEGVSSRMRELCGDYDYVLFDAQALSDGCEVNLLARATDTTVICLSSGKSLPTALQHTLAELQKISVSVAGVVITGIRKRAFHATKTS